MMATINEAACTGCGACVEVCPVEAISIEGKKARIDAVRCIGCGVCVGECPMEAIRVE